MLRLAQLIKWKKSPPALLPALTHIINTSLLTGIFPTAFKQAQVTPLLKKPNIWDNLQNQSQIAGNSYFRIVCGLGVLFTTPKLSHI